MKDGCTRRSSLKTTAVAGTITGLAGIAAHAAPGKTIKVALVGCGGRGKGDLNNFLKACKQLDLKGEVVALADAFEGQVKALAEKLNVSDSNCHS